MLANSGWPYPGPCDGVSMRHRAPGEGVDANDEPDPQTPGSRARWSDRNSSPSGASVDAPCRGEERTK